MSSRLPISKRNALIADYNDGKVDPDYEVIPSKTTKGKYTVRKRKQSIVPPPQEEEKVPEEKPDIKPLKTDTEEEEDAEVDDQTSSMFNPLAYFQEYQLQVNKLLIEQMKALRQNNKYLTKKQQKYKERQKQIRNIFAGIANEKEESEPETNEEPQVENHEEEEVHENPKSYFQNDYPQPDTKEEKMEKVPDSEPEPVQYKNDYEAQLDQMANPVAYRSRRDRIKAFI